MLSREKLVELNDKLYELRMETNSVILELNSPSHSLSENDLKSLSDRCDLIGDDFKELCLELSIHIEE